MERGSRNEQKDTLHELIPQTDCVVHFGHSIGKGQDGKWYLTRLLQTVEELGQAPDGFRRFIRTGQRDWVTPNNPSAIVGGGVIAAVAAVEMYRHLKDRGQTPKVVVQCGGRPGYLDKAAPEDPNLSEAKIMRQFFTNRLGHDPQQFLVEHGLTTEDDVRNGLEIAKQQKCKSVTFVGLDIRLPRCRVFYENITSQTNRYDDLEVNFLAAEDVIGDIAARRGRTPQWEKVLREYQESEGYKRTLEAEQGGIQALKANTYGQSLGGTGKT